MTKKKLDLSHTLNPLENELSVTLHELLIQSNHTLPLFDTAIDDFIHKYGGTHYESIDEILQISSTAVSYTQKQPISLDDLIKDLTS